MRWTIARLLAAGILTTSLVATSLGPAKAAGGADLAATAKWVGTGTPRAGVGQMVTLAITVSNLGPDTSANTFFFAQVPDAFNLVSMTCSDAAFCSSPGGALPPGQTVTATVIEIVCCFPAGASRTTTAGASIVSLDDPNLGNDDALVQIKIVGPHGFSFP
jgi:uncharacterized repeat protein (TIGR01451 family)